MRPLNLEQPWALLPQEEVQAQAYRVTYKGHQAVHLDNGAISAVIEENGRASFLDKTGRCSCRSTSGTGPCGAPTTAL